MKKLLLLLTIGMLYTAQGQKIQTHQDVLDYIYELQIEELEWANKNNTSLAVPLTLSKNTPKVIETTQKGLALPYSDKKYDFSPKTVTTYRFYDDGTIMQEEFLEITDDAGTAKLYGGRTKKVKQFDHGNYGYVTQTIHPIYIENGMFKILTINKIN